MIQGVVNSAYEAVIPLTVQGPSRRTRDIQAVVDTGFTGFLTLPSPLVTELGLLYRHRGRAILADGSQVFFDIYDVAVLWAGEPRYIRVGVADATPLVGMRLLDRHNLNIAVEDGGRVVIQAKE